MPDTLSPLLDRLTSLIAWLAARIAGQGGQAGLDHPCAGALIARLNRLLARFRAVAASPIPAPKPAPKPAKPKFVPTHSFREWTEAMLQPPPATLPRTWRWLLRLLPSAAAGRGQVEDLLRDPALQERLAVDPRLGPILRPLGWMLGVDRTLLPASRWRRRPVVVVPGGRADAAAAAADYAAARTKSMSWGDFVALRCMPSDNRRDRRPIWRSPSRARLAPAQNSA